MKLEFIAHIKNVCGERMNHILIRNKSDSFLHIYKSSCTELHIIFIIMIFLLNY